MTAKSCLTPFSLTPNVVAAPVLGLVSMLLAPLPAYAAEDIDAGNLLNMSLAELSEIEITSVSKVAEKRTEAAAAIFVITQEDIKNSGATAIPELLRMAPGITVTRAASNSWTVTSRGFNGQFSNKLLVLMDGRTLYSPLFSGVLWDVQDTPLEDIERIEVIRGPGGTLWGANAVNGVINIITKNAKDTQGGMASFAAGNQIRGIGTMRYGAKVGEESYFRVYAKQREYNPEYTLAGNSANDDWARSQIGFRADMKIDDDNKLNIQGDVYRNDENANYNVPSLSAAPTYTVPAFGTDARGYNIMTNWEHTHSPNSLSTLQAYLDYTDYKTSFFNDATSTYDVEYQNNWTGWDRHEIVSGVGYRLVVSENNPQTATYSLNPRRRYDQLYNAFIQDKIALVEDELFLTLGSKYENNNYTGNEIQPSARMSWLINEDQTLWGSVSRAIHTPSRFTDDASLLAAVVPPGVLPTAVQLSGNKDIDSEVLIAYELGYRIQPTKSSSLDISTFFNDYSELFRDTFGTVQAPLFPGPYALLPVYAQNLNKATSYGFELSGKWNVTKDWHLSGTYSFIDLKFEDKNGGLSSSFVAQNPKHQYNIRSSYQINDDLRMNNMLYYVSNISGAGIKSYYRFDSNLSYTIVPGVELSVVGQNLFRNRHQEYSPFQFRNPTEIGRSIYGGVRFDF